MVGFRVFDVGLLVIWLVWFFRLRDDDDDSRGDDGGGGEGPGPRGGRDGPGGGGHQAARWVPGTSVAAACATTRARPASSGDAATSRTCRRRARATPQLAGADAPEPVGQPQAPGFSLQYCSNRSAGLPCGGGASFSGVSPGACGVVVGSLLRQRLGGRIDRRGGRGRPVHRRRRGPGGRGRERELGQLASRRWWTARRRLRSRRWRRPPSSSQRSSAHARSALDGRKSPAAVGAVVQVVLDELLERAAAQAQVLDRVGQVARRGRQRQHGPDHLELLAATRGPRRSRPARPHGRSRGRSGRAGGTSDGRASAAEE